MLFRSWSPLPLLLLLATHHATRTCEGESTTCLTVYKEGGAPAVFRSPKCPSWNLPSYDSSRRATSSTTRRCESAVLQGRRRSQEDRTLCALDIPIPFPGKGGVKEVMVGIVAVFDGHNGAEASEMASSLLMEYMALHTYFLLDAVYSLLAKKSAGWFPYREERDLSFEVLNFNKELGPHEFNFERFKFSFPADFDDSLHLEILKQALLRTIHDIDATFSKEAYRNNVEAGSTATIVLMADGQVLVANIGDSKALLCSENFHSPAEAKATLLRLYREKRRSGAFSPKTDYNSLKFAASNGMMNFIAEELTRDHHPDRDDERSRVETAGGYVVEWDGVPRVNGELAVSRAIGDVNFKSYGVISSPEVNDWRPLSVNDTFLVVASDGIFEKLSLQDVCDVLLAAQSDGSETYELSSSCSYSLADCLVNTAYDKGSMDNVAAVVVPLGCYGRISGNLKEENFIGEEFTYCSTKEQRKFVHEQPVHKIKSELVELKYGYPVTSNLDRLLVEKKRGILGCYYLSENLDSKVDLSQAKNKPEDYADEDLTQALPEALSFDSGGPLNLYNDLNFCLHAGSTGDGIGDQCINPDGFAGFLKLLESIPFHDTGSDSGSKEYATPDLRYVLKKRFGRGSYGEVWLAFHWDCGQESNASSWNQNTDNASFHTSFENSSCGTGFNSDATYPDDDLFILKRIMVERGSVVYLSGLREKYFGEVFLNASRSLGGPSEDSTALWLEEFEPDFCDVLGLSDLDFGLGKSWNFENFLFKKFGKRRATFEEGLNHIARYVESFESKSNDIWLVFHHEGISLSKLIYTVEAIEDESGEENVKEAKHVQVLRPSQWWHWLKTTKEGNDELRNLIWQLLMALKSCHDRNITHRDIKPENMVICFEDPMTGRCLKRVPTGDKNYTTKMRIIDFGSALDEFTLKHLYGSSGPSRAEQTYEYTPPEAFLNARWYLGSRRENLKYDMWSVGVVFLELVLGSPNVFQISALTRTLLDPHIKGWNEDLKELTYKLRSLMELCILVPRSSSKRHNTFSKDRVSPASWKCSEEFFSYQIKSRDPLGIGFPSNLALRLVRQLLAWDWEDRLGVDDALRHPYFQPPPSG